MRKYQQLLLLFISSFSVAVLFIYKSENNRLKSVLQVVNFFGRTDSTLNQRTGISNFSKFDFTYPLPVWQNVGEFFYAYSAFWNYNDLVTGGEAIVLVAGKQDAIMNFQCNLLYKSGTRRVIGKFRFQRVNYKKNTDRDFSIYKFFCRITQPGYPESVTFTNNTKTASSTTNKLHLRYIKTNSYIEQQPITVCVDFVNLDTNLSFVLDAKKLEQFFFHHHVIGIEHFIIYNSNEIPFEVIQLLNRANIQLHLLPFNFPFKTDNTNSIRNILEMDCLIRNIHHSQYTLVLRPNEFFYPNNKVPGMLRYLNYYAKEIFKFKLHLFAVCVEDSKKMLVDNTLYKEEIHNYGIFLYRTQLSELSSLIEERSNNTIPLSTMITHRYVSCSHNVKDLHDWRNLIHQDFMQSLLAVRNEVDALVS